MVSIKVLMEPRFIMKILQFIFVICAFACTVDFKENLTVHITCEEMTTDAVTTDASTTDAPTTDAPTTDAPTTDTPTTDAPTTDAPTTDAPTTDAPTTDTTEENTDIVLSGVIQYPFRFYDVSPSGLYCNGTDLVLETSGDYEVTSEFYVFVGVSAMLYVILAMVGYVLMESSYDKEGFLPLVDLAVHAVYTLFWFGGAIAFAVALDGMKKASKAGALRSDNPDYCNEMNNCSTEKIDWELLNSAVVFGFLNFVLFGANMWFIYKETKFSS